MVVVMVDYAVSRLLWCVVYVGVCLLGRLLVCCRAEIAKGLQTSVFEQHPLIQQVTCSGDTLDSSAALLTMTLYSPSNVRSNVIATISVVKTKCTTSATFSSCHLDLRDSRASRLRTLVTGLKIGERRSFGCTVGYEIGGWPKTVTWSVTLMRNPFGTRFHLFHEFPVTR
ncbi:uncharacterized protein LOC143291366 [Babylonia areolata]|uniref:uncharacterized protein LOC143291366 n=1 Tax=Babylonia areolata TaxID=304850 RepID=UPI003FCFC4FB